MNRGETEWNRKEWDEIWFEEKSPSHYDLNGDLCASSGSNESNVWNPLACDLLLMLLRCYSNSMIVCGAFV